MREGVQEKRGKGLDLDHGSFMWLNEKKDPISQRDGGKLDKHKINQEGYLF